MLPVVQIVLILEIEKSSLERFDLRGPPASLSTPWYGAGGIGPLLFANFRSCSVERRHLGHKRFATLATPSPIASRPIRVRASLRELNVGQGARSWSVVRAAPSPQSS